MNRKCVDRECLRSVPCNFVIDIVVGTGDDGVREAFVMSFREFNIDGMALSKSDSFIMNRWLVCSRKCCKANY